MPNNRKRPEKKVLVKLFITQGLDGAQIAKRLGVGRTSVNRWLHDYGLREIKRKPRPMPLYKPKPDIKAINDLLRKAWV